MLLLLPVKFNSQWGLITVQVVLHGFGRGIWENTNKAIIADIVQLSPKLLTVINDSSSSSTISSSNSNNSAGSSSVLLSSGLHSNTNINTHTHTHTDTDHHELVVELECVAKNDDVISAVYANICFFSGLGGAIGYFSYPFLSTTTSQLIICCICIASLFSISTNYTNYKK